MMTGSVTNYRRLPIPLVRVTTHRFFIFHLLVTVSFSSYLSFHFFSPSPLLSYRFRFLLLFIGHLIIPPTLSRYCCTELRVSLSYVFFHLLFITLLVILNYIIYCPFQASWPRDYFCKKKSHNCPAAITSQRANIPHRKLYQTMPKI